MNLYDQKQRNLEHIGQIQAMPPTKRWRAIRDMMRSMNPKIRMVDDEFIRNLKETRDTRLNDYGSNKSMDIRYLLDLPMYMYEALITVDQELLTSINSKDKKVETAAWRKLASVFPEYRIARKI